MSVLWTLREEVESSRESSREWQIAVERAVERTVEVGTGVWNLLEPPQTVFLLCPRWRCLSSLMYLLHISSSYFNSLSFSFSSSLSSYSSSSSYFNSSYSSLSSYSFSSSYFICSYSSSYIPNTRFSVPAVLLLFIINLLSPNFHLLVLKHPCSFIHTIDKSGTNH